MCMCFHITGKRKIVLQLSRFKWILCVVKDEQLATWMATNIVHRIFVQVNFWSFTLSVYFFYLLLLAAVHNIIPFLYNFIWYQYFLLILLQVLQTHKKQEWKDKKHVASLNITNLYKYVPCYTMLLAVN